MAVRDKPVGHAFEPTQALPEHQERLRRQRPRRRHRHVPNHVPLGTRVLATWLAVGWGAWALVGFVTGHFLIFIGGKRNAVVIDFDGWASGLASLALLCVIAISLSWIVDHHDRRDNEAAYQRFRRSMKWGAGTLLVCAVLVDCSGEIGMSPVLTYPLSAPTDALRPLVKPTAIGQWLRSVDLPLVVWIALCGIPLAVSYALVKIMRPPEHSLLGAVIALVGFLPSIVFFSLVVLGAVLGGAFDTSTNPAMQTWAEKDWRKVVAFAWSATVMVAMIWSLLALVLVLVTLRVICGDPQPWKPNPHV